MSKILIAATVFPLKLLAIASGSTIVFPLASGIVKLRLQKNMNESTLPISDNRIRVLNVSNCCHSQLGFFSSNTLPMPTYSLHANLTE